ncbi:MAG: hypothetical protein JO345_34500 [Streptosporangiaceae bacterium]|nr:hypothetical protein [Streptosporangiaceae bacterium]
MAILGMAGPTETAPPVVIIDATELARRTGQVLREVSLGAVIEVVDGRNGVVVGWLSLDPPPGVDTSLLPSPGSQFDHLPLDPGPMDSA